ncbi:alpha/beta hydrolase family esterase [Methylobacterium sp. E-045]|uniref:extracellular catalytic domain type 1 short-chain-length polyhydroxyalkanoate depolymerase n=1 Tax=Methylobacterium sp. E-045 TaxID=2836575 RepID=UPI001FB89A62|nr:PHB depolymerase family esterase [Methylobacterium sp. E-045]MCJ2129460.1 PHB depolymerase family esterase [Methylobacterium sp. E-045]
MADHPNRTRLDDLVEATKLTGAGRLQEAADLIQRGLFRRSDAEASGQMVQVGGGESAQPAHPTAGSVTEGLQDHLRDAFGQVARKFGLTGQGVVAPGSTPSGFSGFDPTNLFRDGKVATPPAGEGSFTEHAFSNDAGAREYKLYVPSKTVASPPLLVMLHGCTQSPDDFAAGTGMNRLAETEGFLVVYPAQSVRAHGQRCWNWYQPGDQGRGSGEAEIIAGLTRAVMSAYNVDARRVYIAGLSAGGAAAANIALAYPDLYAAVGVHSGLAAGCAGDISSALTTMRLGPSGSVVIPPAETARVPTIMVHGESDGTVHPRNGDQVLIQAGVEALHPSVSEGTGPGGLAYTRTRYADESDRVVVESWVVRGLGHSWSGGDPSGSYTDPRGPDASRAMVDFFMAHRLDRPRH